MVLAVSFALSKYMSLSPQNSNVGAEWFASRCSAPCHLSRASFAAASDRGSFAGRFGVGFSTDLARPDLSILTRLSILSRSEQGGSKCMPPTISIVIRSGLEAASSKPVRPPKENPKNPNFPTFQTSSGRGVV